MGRWQPYERTTRKKSPVEEQRQQYKEALLRAYQERKPSTRPTLQTDEIACQDAGPVFFCPGCLKQHRLPQACQCSCMLATSRRGDVHTSKLKEQIAQQPPVKGTAKYGHYPKRRFQRDEDREFEEDDLFIIEDLFEEDESYPPRQSNSAERRYFEEDESYPPRQPHSAGRRYYVPPTPAQNRTSTRLSRHTRPPVTPRVSRNTTPRQKLQIKQEAVKHQKQKQKTWFFYIGAGMLASLALWAVGCAVPSWLQSEHDTLVYGTPRTFQIDANVGHQGTSHFIAENLHGDIVVMEIHPSNLAETKIYQGPMFSGPGTDDLVATLSFKDLNGDGKPDMVISVGNGRYVLVNTGTDFRPTTSSDYIDGV